MTYRYEKSILDNINAMVGTGINNIIHWKRNQHIYSFVDPMYYKYKVSFKLEDIYIKSISSHKIIKGWNGFPSRVDALGYIYINKQEQLIAFNKRNYWLYNDTENKVYNGYPKDLSMLEIFRNNPIFDKINSVDCVFMFKHGNGNTYNCFVTGNTILMVNIYDFKKVKDTTLKEVFPDIPGFINTITPLNNTPYLLILSDHKWFLYNTDTSILVNSSGEEVRSGQQLDIADSYSDKMKFTEQTKRMQEWCKQLYNRGVYNQEDYNTCIGESRMVGMNVSNVKAIKEAKHKREKLKYDLALYKSGVISNKSKATLVNNELVYIVSTSGHYLTCSADGVINVKPTIKEPVSDYGWFIEKLDNGEYGIKNNYQKYLQYDKNQFNAINEYIGPLSRWRLKEYGQNFTIEHTNTDKAIKSVPLSLDFYTPDDSMIWNIIAQSDENIFKRYDKTKITNEVEQMVKALNHSYYNFNKIEESIRMENAYTKQAVKGFNNLDNYCSRFINKTAQQYYYPLPMDNEKKKDVDYRVYYAKINSWRYKVGPSNQTINVYRPNTNQTRRSRRDNNKYAPYGYKINRIKPSTYYNIAKKHVNNHYNNLKTVIRNKKIEYRANRNEKFVKPLYKSRQTYLKEYKEKERDIEQWKTKMELKIKENEIERDKLKKKIQLQLNKIYKLKVNQGDLDLKLQEYGNINTGNLSMLEMQNNSVEKELQMLYILLGLGILWGCLLIFLMFK